ncbi:MAG: HMA2 domain-containing protein [Stellaceae bacterium]
MLEYVHFVPGRLRLKITTLKNRRRAAEAEAYVAAIPMVTSAVANPLTGSLTINFDHRRLSIGDLWEKLRVLGYVSQNRPELATDRPEVDRFGRVVAAALIEAVVQHSAQALVRALL